MDNRDFENGTRTQAEELIIVLTSMYPALLRKTEEIRTMFIPSLFRCLTEVDLPEDDEQEEWKTKIEGDELSKTDMHTVSKINLGRFAAAIGEKTILSSSSDLIKEAITNEDWKVRVAGYSFLGYISESCKEAFKQNLDEIMRMAASGVVDPHLRVKFAGITCLGLMLSEQAPDA